MVMKKLHILIIFTVLFVACSPKQDTTKHIEDVQFVKIEEITSLKLQKLQYEDIYGFDTDDTDTALFVFQRACTKSKKDPNLTYVCSKAQAYKDGKTFFKTFFTPYMLYKSNGEKDGMLTGYYEPIISGSLIKTKKYRFAVLKVPKNKWKKRLSRARLNKINHKPHQVLFYTDNKIDPFFMEIQGSGKVKLTDGSMRNVGYAGQNGKKFYAIGKKLLQINAIKEKNMSLEATRQWCEENPKDSQKLLNMNESKVYFAFREQGATGSLGVPLVARRNIAVDRRHIPLGFPVFVQSFNPYTKDTLNTLTVAADVGGAIKGEIRADFFWGTGKEALKYASRMKDRLNMIILIPKVGYRR
jgi:membrane-bound lytic murein transglycosylase A